MSICISPIWTNYTVVLLRTLQFVTTIPLPGRGITPPPVERFQTNPGKAIGRVTEMDVKKERLYSGEEQEKGLNSRFMMQDSDGHTVIIRTKLLMDIQVGRIYYLKDLTPLDKQLELEDKTQKFI